MKIKSLKVTIEGALWRIHDFEIENIDVLDKYEEEDGKGIVKVKDFTLTDDNVLDVYIYVGAPNGTDYTVTLEGTVDNAEKKSFKYSEDFEVVKNGRLKILIAQNVNELINKQS